MILQKHMIYESLNWIDVERWLKFIEKIQDGYNPVSYHNKTHAADVAQTIYYFFINSEIDNLELFAMILASAIHDFEHPGYNNAYLVNTSHPLAIRYNDQSVLEMHHVAASFKVTWEWKYNFMIDLNEDM